MATELDAAIIGWMCEQTPVQFLMALVFLALP